MPGKYKPRGLPPKKPCGCGCGKIFQPLTRRAQFIDDTHRQRQLRKRRRSENSPTIVGSAR
jgi:hypothetical protein